MRKFELIYGLIYLSFFFSCNDIMNICRLYALVLQEIEQYVKFSLNNYSLLVLSAYRTLHMIALFQIVRQDGIFVDQLS